VVGGQRVDEVKEFKTYEEAKKFQIKFNSANNEDHTPDWYMVAHNPVFDSTEIDKKLKNK
jgi:pterin-4a-carbinolamine dehydratase